MRPGSPAPWSPTVTGAGRCCCSPPRPAGRPTSRTTAWSTPSAGLVDEGRVKLYCVDSFDAGSWSDRSLPLEERARRHGAYAALAAHAGGALDPRRLRGARSPIVAAGPSLGAFHAVNLALRRADLFPVAIGLSGSYDPAVWNGWGERGDAVYFHNPVDYVGHLHGDHLEWLRSRLFVELVVGRGACEEHPTRALLLHAPAGGAARQQGTPARARVWGEDVAARLASWRAQLATYLPRFSLRSCHVLDVRHPAPDRPAARHRGGLAAGLRDPDPHGSGP